MTAVNIFKDEFERTSFYKFWNKNSNLPLNGFQKHRTSNLLRLLHCPLVFAPARSPLNVEELANDLYLVVKYSVHLLNRLLCKIWRVASCTILGTLHSLARTNRLMHAKANHHSFKTVRKYEIRKRSPEIFRCILWREPKKYFHSKYQGNTSLLIR